MLEKIIKLFQNVQIKNLKNQIKDLKLENQIISTVRNKEIEKLKQHYEKQISALRLHYEHINQLYELYHTNNSQLNIIECLNILQDMPLHYINTLHTYLDLIKQDILYKIIKNTNDINHILYCNGCLAAIERIHKDLQTKEKACVIGEITREIKQKTKKQKKPGQAYM